ncbi:MAG: electron transfer flavoprotein subunit alpha/FixB family protein [Chloroflexi bacterium]|nr:electron transfer flavoprotein subunit alpha/FixB family protein [Chloroflexota bacterium]
MKPEIYVLIERLGGQVADISYTLLAAAGKLAPAIEAGVVAVLLGHEIQELANDLKADRVLYFDHPALADFSPSAYRRVMTALIKENKPRLALFGDTSMGVDIAGPLSMRLDLPLVSSCRAIQAGEGGLRFTSQICGGKLLAEGTLPETTTLVAMIPGGYKGEEGRAAQPPVVVWESVPPFEQMPIKFRQYHAPPVSDVDISKEPVLISVGRGIQNQDALDMVQELARALGGVVSASRPVVDQGWLPTSRLVGKSGKRVKPKIYLALGISGAPEHVEAITDAEIIIAVNTDPAAPIFSVAHYGAEVDLFDLVPALTAAVEQAKMAA